MAKHSDRGGDKRQCVNERHGRSVPGDTSVDDNSKKNQDPSRVSTVSRIEAELSVNGLTNLFSKYSRPFISTLMDIPTLKIGCAGLGRMGKRHADHFLHKVPRATLVAASTPDEEELEWASKHLAPFGVTLYKSYDEMIEHEGLQAVVIASITTVHADQAIKAIKADKHVLCEKPLSTSVDVVRPRH